ncbi:MMPL family transporter [Enterovirga sp. DB1703]|uniref:MMPL family transporter n=1 Tax=Enterovirga aerilata TaxID=2730920 RepID=A0A849HZF1_9HYPH|nr:MMPL family transporter [Enterovirga sp. DB1703]
MAELLVHGSIRQPWIVVVAATILTLIGLYVSVTRFAITTETDQLLQSDAAWSRDKSEFQAAFPHLSKVILAVVDGETPELAESAAARLTAALAEKPGPNIRKVWRPDGGPYFEKNGLLLLPLEDLKRTLAQIGEQAPVLSALAGDPTLRGLARLIQLGAGQGALGENASLVDQLNGVVERVLAGQPARLSWRQLMSGGRAPDPHQLRKFVLVEPILDYEALQPGEAATTRIRQAAAELGLAQQNGVRVRLTGQPPLADEEFGTVRDGAPVHLGLTIVAIAVILYLALRSGRLIFAVLATTMAGLIITVGAGLLLVGRFNVISVAVAALFLGLGVDFSIQVAVRYRDERHKLHELRTAILATARGMGWSLTLAAMSLLVGFFSFLPTAFTGVSELGLITGVGMIIAFVASLTLLPALIALLPPPPEPETIEIPALARIDHWILANRKLVIIASTAIVVLGLPFLLKLEFDANPMHLRSEKTEAVATFLDLTRTPGMTPNTISVLAPSLETARPLAARLAALPEVARVATVLTFVPDNQDEKLRLVRETAEELADVIGDRPPAPPPTDAELVQALRRAADSLQAPAASSGPQGEVLRRLGQSFARLAEAPPDRRTAAQEAIAGGLPPLLAGLRTALTPDRVTLAELPQHLRDDWISRDGRARIEVSPKGDANDNAVLEQFTAAVERVAPNLSGGPVDIVESGKVIARAFMIAAILALIGVFGILTLALRHPRDVALTLGPLVVATIMTLETAQLIGMPLNLANVIALPLMLAVGVAFHIYYMVAWRDGLADMLASSLTRAIFFSSLTTGIAFGSLWLSNHPGTASMGKLLTISLFFTLLAAFIMVPAFLGPPRTHPDAQEPDRKA